MTDLEKIILREVKKGIDMTVTRFHRDVFSCQKEERELRKKTVRSVINEYKRDMMEIN